MTHLQRDEGLWWPRGAALTLTLATALFAPYLWWLGVAGLALAWGLRRRAVGSWWVRTPLDWPLWLLTVSGVVSYAAAVYVTGEWVGAFARLLIFGLGLTLFADLASIEASPTNLRRAWLVMAAAGAVMAGLGILGGALPDKLPLVGNLAQRLPRVLSGWPGAAAGFHPNQVAGTLLWFLPAPVAVWRARRSDSAEHSVAVTFFLWACLGLSGVSFVLMQSRIALVGVVVASVSLLPFFGRWGKLAAAAIVGAVLFGVLLIGPARLYTFITSQFIQEATGVFDPGWRQRLWVAGFQAIHDFAYTGMGLGLFRRLGPYLYDFPILPADVGHAHNIWLHTGAEIGLPGLISQAALWGLSAALTIGGARRNNSLRPYFLAAWWALIAYTVFGLTDAVALGAKTSVAWWAYLGLLALTSRRDALRVPV